MFPYIEINGTHRNIGRAIGESLRKQIKRSLDLHFNELHRREKKLHLKGFSELTKTVKKYYPDFLSEVEGIAEGSGEKFEQLLMFSFEEELLPGERCTTLAVKSKNNIIFAHNEDYDIGLPFYIIKAKPKGKPKFLSVSQAGQFPGTVVGLNDEGVAYSGNSIQTETNFKGLPKTYCLRKFLECKSVEEAVRSVARFDRAIGNNSVLVSAREKRIASLEWTPREYALHETGNIMVHTNHYISDKLKNMRTPSKSSEKRYHEISEKALRLAEPKVSDIKKLMKIHIDSKFSVCQHGGVGDCTLSSIVINLREKEMLVTDGNPCKNPYKKYIL